MKIINNKYLDYLIRKIFGLLCFIKKNRITLLQESYSGSNTFALNYFLSKRFKTKFEIILIKECKNIFLKYYYLATSKMIICTHGSYRFRKKQITFQLWHGPMIKKNLVMLDSNNYCYKDGWYGFDYILSYSQTYSTLMNACILANEKQYKILGAPRNDFLFINNKNTLIKNDFKKKILVTMTMNHNNFFKYDIFANQNIDSFLGENDFTMYIKPHPHDEDKFNKKLFTNYKNIFQLFDEDLSKAKIDMYQILNQFDLLVTDYSSIFFDYLLLDRPIFFLRDDDFTRGFLIEDLDSFLPGPIFNKPKQFKDYLSGLEEVNQNFKLRRDIVRKQFHRYNDNYSSKRVEKFINDVIS